MQKNSYVIVIKKSFNDLSTNDINAWLNLFVQSYHCNIEHAKNILDKYAIYNKNSIFCFIYYNENIVASYSGIVKNFNNRNIFISMDTMSNGFIHNATFKMANFLYDYLRLNGFCFVCGFPNKNIINIRIRKLSWVICGSLRGYIGIPFFWRFFLFKKSHLSNLWCINRPPHGFFIKRVGFINLLGRNGLYKNNFFSLIFTLSAKSPGVFFFRIPNFILNEKKFGFKILNNDCIGEKEILEIINYLDLNCIDIP